MKLVFKKIIVTILTFEARAVLWRYKPKVIAITGSVGKTTTKDAIYSIVSPDFNVVKSQKSFNSELGVPLTILGLPNGWNNPFVWLANIFEGFFLFFHFPKGYPDWLILEVGADHPGDIKKLGSWLRTDVVVITKLSKVPVHVEFFNSPKEVLREKAYLIETLKNSGTLILNADDSDVMDMRSYKRQVRLSTFGIEQPSDFQASNIDFAYQHKNGDQVISGINFKVNHDGSSVPIQISGALGKQHVYPVLAALAVGESLGMNLVRMSENLKSHDLPAGRMRLLSGVKNTIIIDDTYNSSPVAVAEALRALTEIKSEHRKLVVLGDMLDLGKYSEDAHKKAGKESVKAANILVTVGIKARDIAIGALDNQMDEKNIFQFDDAEEAAKFVEDLLLPGDIVLVKGSQGVRLEKIVEEIMADPENKETLLVRQDLEWQSR